ncbi:MAG: hypothetical protein HY319_23280 [Armatimonadetes bacterium]|nr:hypothetical protein [Armatimonadota bacterium]
MNGNNRWVELLREAYSDVLPEEELPEPPERECRTALEWLDWAAERA